MTENLLRELIVEIIRKCGDDWCLYTKGKDKSTGRRRRLALAVVQGPWVQGP